MGRIEDEPAMLRVGFHGLSRIVEESGQEMDGRTDGHRCGDEEEACFRVEQAELYERVLGQEDVSVRGA